MNIKIGFIGAGNMGSAIIKGISAKKLLNSENIFISDATPAKAAQLAGEVGANTCGNVELTKACDIVFIAVKPNYVREVLDEIKPYFDENKLLVSIAVGIPLSFYKYVLGESTRVIRVMPNTPALVGEGMSLISYEEEVTEEDVKNVKTLLGCTGLVEVLEERLMNEVTALTGSSPAYVFMFIEAMADAAVQSGIPRALAYRLAAQSVLGSAKMVIDTGKHPGELKDQVCSPAGTTIDAVYSLEKNGFRGIVMEAMGKCTDKAREIGRNFK